MAVLELTPEEKKLLFIDADFELLGKVVRQLLATNPNMELFQATSIVGAGLLLAYHASSANATGIDSHVTLGDGNQWHIDISKITGTQ